MTHKLHALFAAVLALAAVPAAHANLSLTNATSGGNSSLAFVAMDNNGTISYTADLGVRMADFLPLIAGQTFSQGTLAAPGTTAVFNLFSNTYTLNGVAQTGNYSWSTNLNTFLANSSTVSGSYQWGVVAGDGTLGDLSGTNPVRNQNILYTSGAFVDYDNSNASGTNPAAVNGAQGQINQFFAASNAAGGTHAANVSGSNTATSGTAFLGTSMALFGQGNFSQQFGNNNYLQNPGDTSYFSWTYVNGTTSSTATLGNVLGVGQDPALPATWTFDGVTGNLTYTVPVPEASTYAMLLAGLAALSLVVRRNRSAD